MSDSFCVHELAIFESHQYKDQPFLCPSCGEQDVWMEGQRLFEDVRGYKHFHSVWECMKCHRSGPHSEFYVHRYARAAAHEAGHIVMRHILGWAVVKAGLEMPLSNNSLEYCAVVIGPEPLDDDIQNDSGLAHELSWLLTAGVAAEVLIWGRPDLETQSLGNKESDRARHAALVGLNPDVPSWDASIFEAQHELAVEPWCTWLETVSKALYKNPARIWTGRELEALAKDSKVSLPPIILPYLGPCKRLEKRSGWGIFVNRAQIK